MIKKPNVDDEHFELKPTNGRKSFYKKAFVFKDKYGNQILRSYESFVCYKDKNGNIHRTCNEITMTTGIHIKSFCGLNKRQYMNLKYEEIN